MERSWLSVIALALWNVWIIPIGFTISALGFLYGVSWAWVFFYLWLAGNIGLVYRLSQSRKHQEVGTLDDHVPVREQLDAEQWLISHPLPHSPAKPPSAVEKAVKKIVAGAFAVGAMASWMVSGIFAFAPGLLHLVYYADHFSGFLGFLLFGFILAFLSRLASDW